MANLNEVYNMLKQAEPRNPKRKVWCPIIQKQCDSCGNTKSFITSNDGYVTQICGICGKKYYFPQNAL